MSWLCWQGRLTRMVTEELILRMDRLRHGHQGFVASSCHQAKCALWRCSYFLLKIANIRKGCAISRKEGSNMLVVQRTLMHERWRRHKG